MNPAKEGTTKISRIVERNQIMLAMKTVFVAPVRQERKMIRECPITLSIYLKTSPQSGKKHF